MTDMVKLLLGLSDSWLQTERSALEWPITFQTVQTVQAPNQSIFGMAKLHTYSEFTLYAVTTWPRLLPDTFSDNLHASMILCSMFPCFYFLLPI